MSKKKEVSGKQQGNYKDMPRFNKLVAEIKAKSTTPKRTETKPPREHNGYE